MNLQAGHYFLEFPDNLKLEKEEVNFEAIQRTSSHWTIEDGDFSIRIHLEEKMNPSDLGEFILSCTKQRVSLSDVCINGIEGKKYGEYSVGRSWIDWWMKEGDQMICINLQGDGFPSDDQKNRLEGVIKSLTTNRSEQGVVGNA